MISATPPAQQGCAAAWWLPRFLVLTCVCALSGCAVVTVAGAAAGAAVSVTGAVVSSGVKVAGKVVEKTIDVVTPSSGKP